MPVPAAVAVLVEEAEPQDIDEKPGGADADDHPGLLDLVRLGKALDGLQQDGEAERGEEDGVDQRAHHLGPHPAEGVLFGGASALGEAHGHQRHHQRHHVRQHVEGVREHGQRGRHAAHHHLHHEEEERQRQHAQQPHPPAPVAPTRRLGQSRALARTLHAHRGRRARADSPPQPHTRQPRQRAV
uniref:Uncharacterized protein n=1 Tax=Salvator merianae TaxID=96440 RepID=A0A8D0DZ26_SALMN